VIPLRRGTAVPQRLGFSTMDVRGEQGDDDGEESSVRAHQT